MIAIAEYPCDVADSLLCETQHRFYGVTDPLASTHSTNFSAMPVKPNEMVGLTFHMHFSVTNSLQVKIRSGGMAVSSRSPAGILIRDVYVGCQGLNDDPS